MTSIGVILLCVGLLLVRMFGVDSVSFYYLGRTNRWDIVGIFFCFTGGVLTLVGVALWLWEVMP